MSVMRLRNNLIPFDEIIGSVRGVLPSDTEFLIEVESINRSGIKMQRFRIPRGCWMSSYAWNPVLQSICFWEQSFNKVIEVSIYVVFK